jgi:hypothetical protein
MGNNAAAADAILTQYRPVQIIDFLEEYWRNTAPFLPPLQQPVDPGFARTQFLDDDAPVPAPPALPFHHLAYAFCLENTRVVDIMRRVVQEYAIGERLPQATPQTQRWLHTTEELFFAPSGPFSVRSVSSWVRPDDGAVRRNAYYRLLGMDLSHGTEDGRPYPYIKPEASNREFSLVFETLLTEVWRGYVNRLNGLNENLTDNSAIGELVRRLHEMLNARRLNGNIARLEFSAVALLSWMFLTVAYNTAIVLNLNAGAAGHADRLQRVGHRVGLPANARADSYFQLAAPMSVVLRAIEEDGAIPAIDLYDGLYTNEILLIITHWSIATGRSIKDFAPIRQPAARQYAAPVPSGAVLQSTAPRPPVPATPARNGSGVNRLTGVLS